MAEEWVKFGVEKRSGSLDEFPTNGEAEPLTGIKVEGELRGDPAETAMRTIEYRHPDDDEDGVHWHTIIKLAAYARVVEFNLELRTGEDTYRLTKTRSEPGPPWIVRQLVDRFECLLGGRRLSREPKIVTADGALDFVDDVIFSQERRLPIVAVSPEEESGEPLVDTDQLAEYLTGLAEVYRIAGERTTYRLSDYLPADFSVYNGAVRIYWAGIDQDDSPYAHPLFTRGKIQNWLDSGRTPYWRISQKVFAASADLHQDGPVLKQARSDLLGKVRQEFQEARKKAETKEELDERVDTLVDELRQKEKIIKNLQKENDDLRRKFHEYHRELAEDAGHPAPEGHVDQEPDSVHDALLIAQDRHSDVLEVWESAFDAAAESNSDHGSEALNTLEVLADVSRDYFAAREEGEGLGDNLENIFRDRGASKYAHTETDATMNQYGDARHFRQDDREHTFEKHFTIGKGSKKHCVQIYFEFPEGDDRTVVAYCGEHLPSESWDS